MRVPLLLAAILLVALVPVAAASDSSASILSSGSAQATLEAGHSGSYEFRLALKGHQPGRTADLVLRAQPGADGLTLASRVLLKKDGDASFAPATTVDRAGTLFVVPGLAESLYTVRVEATVPADADVGLHHTALGLAARDPGTTNPPTAFVSYRYDVTVTSASDRAPTGVAATCTTSGLHASCQASGHDPDGHAVTFAWDFGDGGSATGPTATHKYSSQGSYTVRLTADDGTRTATAQATVVADLSSLPAQVTGLRLVEAGQTTARIAWDAAPRATSYKVLRGLTSTSLQQVAQVPSAEFTDTGLLPGTGYAYRILASNADGDAGAPSALLAVTTQAAQDTQAPTAVGNLRTEQVANTSLSLRWDPATDDRAGVRYEVARVPGGVRGTTTDTFFVDTQLSPGTAYTYEVRAIDAAGNRGAAATLTASTLAATQPDVTAPTVRAVAFVRNATGVWVSWQTDEPATASLDVAGASHPGSSGPATAFRVALGSLAAGTYAYSIHAKDGAGNQGTFEGTLDVPATPTAEAKGADATLVTRVEQAASIDLREGDLFLLDTDGDGLVDQVRDASGQLSQVQGVPKAATFLLRTAGGTYVVVQPEALKATAAALPPAHVQRQDLNLTTVLTITVDQKAGWIVVTVPDPDPAQPLVGLRDADGRDIPLAYTWRSGGSIGFFDDPSYTYTMYLDAAPRDGQEQPASHAGGSTGWIVAGVVVVLLVVVAVALLARRRGAR